MPEKGFGARSISELNTQTPRLYSTDFQVLFFIEHKIHHGSKSPPASWGLESSLHPDFWTDKSTFPVDGRGEGEKNSCEDFATPFFFVLITGK